MGTTKVTVNLPDETVEALKQIAGDLGTTITDALRQVIESHQFLQHETKAGKDLLLQNPKDRTTQRVVFNAKTRR